MAGHLKLDADRARLEDIKAQITHLEVALAALCSKETQIQAQLDSYKFPISTVPPEILGEIFLHSIPQPPEFPPLVGPLSPTNLTHICRYWRQVALGTPALWSAIWSKFGLDAPEWHAFQAWLERSGGTPLRMHITDDDAQGGVNPDFWEVIGDGNIARCEYLKIHLWRKLTWRPSLAPKEPMPLLQELHLMLGKLCPEANNHRFPDAPLLCHGPSSLRSRWGPVHSRSSGESWAKHQDWFIATCCLTAMRTMTWTRP